MKSFFATVLCGTVLMSCAPAVIVPPETTSPPMAVTMTPVHRSADGMIVAHAGLTGWSAGPGALPPGAQMIALEGDPSKAELFTIRLRLPNNYIVPPHSHSAWEHLTIISGVLHLATGDKFSMANAIELRAGSFSAMPSGMRHSVHAAGETVVQLHAMGPWTVTYVNRADDPRNR